ncbi:CNNM domain-containing protein [Massilia scottii]|uniref:CNNM domain-containing protein n=1 Tax=Massilia scottii TaxID=3057166 RepID=UPI004042A0BD
MPEFVAAVIAPPLQALSRAMAPFVRLLSALSDLSMRMLGMGRAPDSAPTADEISGMLRESADAGVLDKTESDIAERALRLDDQRLDALMTPRADLQLIDLDGDRGDNLARIAASPFSRFPVVRGDPSNVLGGVDAGELFAQAIRQRALEAIDIGAAMHRALLVPATVSARGLLEQLRQQHAELALVVDEHGQLKGMVTLNDLMAALIGVLPGNDAREPDAVRRDDGSWQLAARWRPAVGAPARTARDWPGAARRSERGLPDPGRVCAGATWAYACGVRPLCVGTLSFRGGGYGPAPDRPGAGVGAGGGRRHCAGPAALARDASVRRKRVTLPCTMPRPGAGRGIAGFT